MSKFPVNLFINKHSAPWEGITWDRTTLNNSLGQAADPNAMLVGDVASYEQHLLSLLDHALLGYEPEIPTTFIPEPSIKWRVISALQKSIRRGLPEIGIKMANALLDFDERYFYRRLPVIAMEDIGLANISLVSLVLAVSNKKRWRDRVGRKKVCLYLVEQMCRSVKDRMLTELVTIVNLDAQHGEILAAMASKLDHELATIVQASHQDHTEWSDRLLEIVAAHQILGNAFNNEGIPTPKRSNPNALQEAMASQLPGYVHYLLERGGKAGVHGLEAAVPLAWSMMMRSGDLSVIEDENTTGMVGNLPGCTYDQYTHEGKRAYAYFAKAHDPARLFFENHPELKPVHALRGAVFIAESGHLSQRLEYKEAGEVYRQSHEIEMAHYGLGQEDGKELIGIVSNGLDALNRARLRVTDGGYNLPER